MDFNRLPSRKYADEAAQQQRQQRHAQQRPSREQHRQHQEHGVASSPPPAHQDARLPAQLQSFIPPSSLLLGQHDPIMPQLSSQMSSTSDSTKYSPGIDTLDSSKELGLSQQNRRTLVDPSRTDDDLASKDDELIGVGSSVITPADSTAHLFRDTQGNVYHPSVTFAPAPSPRAGAGGRPNTLGLPSLSFGGGNSDNNGTSHPGMGNRRGSSRAAEDGNAGGGFSGADFKRKRSLVRPERERVNPDARHFHYAQHSAAFQAENGGRVGMSDTGYGPTSAHVGLPYGGGQGGIASYGLAPGQDGRPGLRRGKSILAREEGMAAHESGLNFLKRGATMRRNKKGNGGSKEQYPELLKSRSNAAQAAKEKQDGEKAPLTPWMLYCYAITCCLPGVFLKSLGYRTLDRRRAFREKLGLLGLIASLMTAVGFLTFGFTDSVCGNQALRFHAGSIQSGSMIFHGYDYSMDQFQHPAASGVETNSNPLYSDWNAGGKDGSFMFQNVNGNCKGLITAAAGSPIPQDSNGNLGWYFPCNFNDQFSSIEPNKTDYAGGRLCHTQATAREEFATSRNKEVIGMQWQGPVYYTWDNITNSTRNLGVYKSSVLDFSLLNWLDREFVDYPPVFDELARGNTSYEGRDSTMQLLIAGNRTMAECMDDIIRVGFVDSKTIGCVVADIVLYISLVFILAVVGIKFSMAVIYSWFFGRRLGAFKSETKEERQQRIEEVEKWTKDIYRPAPSSYRPNVKNARKSYLPTTSRFTAPVSRPYSTFDATKRQSTFGSKNMLGAGLKNSPPDSPLRASRSNASLPLSSMNLPGDGHSRASSFDMLDGLGRPCPFPLDPNVVPQPPADYQPFKFPLAHTMLLVTAYSESVEGLRTTLDSLATSDYPNSHKFILVIADGLVRGSGNDLTTPDIVLSMMKGLITPAEEVEAMSYVAVADGRKRHNMAKVYAGYYDYDNETVETSKQQRVPMILVAKCGSPFEAHDAKPGNRGKRDSQVLLMAFLQKVMFDERMTNFEYEFFNAIWKVTGVSADNYEHVLMVDADTKVFPDAVTRMVACMVQDVDIMGLCGETKIANKSETWVTMIQVFEYYISHHQTKAFESMWGGVTCLPGCFSMYRIKAPKGGDGYYVPILANPDIVEHYSENVVDNLHKKNLLLLGEDRYLTTLMLKTFPKRKMMFCPQAYCKTVVPDTFRVLLSQRRRWINSTIHNLFELLLVRDLCGTFCFSMQFVVFMELVGTLVLPAAIAFTIYILVLTCIPGREKPIIPLILLACILGLPGLLIVVTSRKIAYVGWMIIYLFSLPIWNAVLPAYAYFHMDDFSWGSTRKIHGEGKGGGHDDKEGEFDSQSIVMKRWSEWERERRWKNGTRSRDSPFDVLQRSGSPHRSTTTRNSVISTTDTFVSQMGQPQDPFFRGAATPSGYSSSSPVAGPGRRQVDNVQVLELPAPLAVTHQPQAYQHIPSQTEIYDSADPNALHNYEASPYQSSSSENFHVNPSPAPRTEEEYPRYPAQEPYDSDAAEREAILSRASIDAYGMKTSPEQDTSAQVLPVTETAQTTRPPSMAPSRASRGVSLYDPGPVSAPDGAVRTVKRHRRSSTANRGRQSLGDVPAGYQLSDDSPPALPSSAQDYALPPGAAPRT